MRRAIQKLIRYYLYMRKGLSHLGVVFSFLTFTNTTFLITKELLWVSLGYIEIIFLTLFLTTPVLILLGYLDFKKGYYATEASLAAEESPFTKDSVEAIITNNEAFKLFMTGKYPEALAKLQETIDLMKKWRPKK